MLELIKIELFVCEIVFFSWTTVKHIACWNTHSPILQKATIRILISSKSSTFIRYQNDTVRNATQLVIERTKPDGTQNKHSFTSKLLPSYCTRQRPHHYTKSRPSIYWSFTVHYSVGVPIIFLARAWITRFISCRLFSLPYFLYLCRQTYRHLQNHDILKAFLCDL